MEYEHIAIYTANLSSRSNNFIYRIVKHTHKCTIMIHVHCYLLCKLVGMLIGGYTWGSLADVFGRKHTLMAAMLFNGICGIISAFSPNFIFFLVFRLASGIG